MRAATVLISLCLTLSSTGVSLAANPLPSTFECFGTEPFWSIKVAPGRARADLMFIDRRYAFAPTSVQQTMNRPDIWLVRGSGRIAKLSLVVRREACSDGMSDNEYPYSAVAAISGLRPIAGCCRPGR
jgi:uncharacterized membrane protein